MNAAAVSLNVADVDASVDFLTTHFGFSVEMSADGFASLARADLGLNVVYLQQGLRILPPEQRDIHARGVILAFVVDDAKKELARIEAAGVTITLPLTDDDWGERSFQVRDPNGVIIQLVEWLDPAQ